MNRIYHLLKFLNYLLKAKGEHSIHSPFVYDLYTKVIKDTGAYYAFENIESVRSKMLLSEKSIDVTDYGTGRSKVRRVSSIASNSVKSAKYGQLLFRFVNAYQPKTIIELGTSLGITTAYLASSSKESRVITMEGCNNIADLAQANFDLLKLNNIERVVGDFDKTLSEIIEGVEIIDLAFFDGNHKLQPTLSYFEKCLKAKDENSIFIFDDIHWSLEMETAWNRIIGYPEVSVSIDLFALGIVLFRKEITKAHYILKF